MAAGTARPRSSSTPTIRGRAGVSWLTGFVPYWSEAPAGGAAAGRADPGCPRSRFRVKTWIEAHQPRRRGESIRRAIGLEAAGRRIAANKFRCHQSASSIFDGPCRRALPMICREGRARGLALKRCEPCCSRQARRPGRSPADDRACAEKPHRSHTTPCRGLRARRPTDLGHMLALAEGRPRRRRASRAAEEIYLGRAAPRSRTRDQSLAPPIRGRGDASGGSFAGWRASVANKGSWGACRAPNPIGCGEGRPAREKPAGCEVFVRGGSAAFAG